MKVVCSTGFVQFSSPGLCGGAARNLASRICSRNPSPIFTEEYKSNFASSRRVTTQNFPSPRSQMSAPESTEISKKLDGKKTAESIRKEIASEIEGLVKEKGEACRPGLAVVIVGERTDSQTYVRSKRKACDEVGISSFGFELPGDCAQEALEKVVDDLNNREDVHGILVQLPLPSHIDDQRVLDRISLEKDVDGFHPLNIGRLCMSRRTPPLFVPCTPKACIELLDRYAINIQGKNAVVIGRSNIVGLPVAMLLLQRNATVTVCHSHTKDTQAKVKDADIVVAACGRAGFVKSHWLKPGAVVIDVGINAVDDSTKKRGYRLVGDVEYDGASKVASYITPVPGGVGPMTIAMLLQNTLIAWKRSIGSQ